MDIAQKRVEEFNEAMNCVRGDKMGFADTELRKKLVQEEVQEFVDAIEANDFVEAVDALADLLYVVYGAAVAWNVDLDPINILVHENNMSKLGGPKDPITGKQLKPSTWQPPDILGELRKQGYGQ